MGKPNLIQIFIIDDHPLIRKGFRQLFEIDADMKVCGEAENILQSLPLIKNCSPDVVIIDTSLPDGSGFDLIKRIHNLDPDIKILVSSMHEELFFAERALRAGAMGYINKKEAAEHIIDAVQRVLKGKIYVSQHMTERLLLKNLTNNISDKTLSSIEMLSDREMEVFEQIGKGYSTAQIASHLNLSIKTIETHRSHIKQKLGLKSATELARRAVQWSMEKL